MALCVCDSYTELIKAAKCKALAEAETLLVPAGELTPHARDMHANGPLSLAAFSRGLLQTRRRLAQRRRKTPTRLMRQSAGGGSEGGDSSGVATEQPVAQTALRMASGSRLLDGGHDGDHAHSQ